MLAAAMSDDLAVLDAEAMRRLPRCCVCGGEAMAYRPGRNPEYSDAPLLIALDDGEQGRAWCWLHSVFGREAIFHG